MVAGDYFYYKVRLKLNNETFHTHEMASIFKKQHDPARKADAKIETPASVIRLSAVGNNHNRESFDCNCIKFEGTLLTSHVRMITKCDKSGHESA